MITPRIPKRPLIGSSQNRAQASITRSKSRILVHVTVRFHDRLYSTKKNLCQLLVSSRSFAHFSTKNINTHARELPGGNTEAKYPSELDQNLIDFTKIVEKEKHDRYFYNKLAVSLLTTCI